MLTIYLWLLLSICFFAVGEYYSKMFALKPSPMLACFVVIVYAIGSLAWLPAILKGQDLARIGLIWTMLSSMITVFLGLVVFHETLTTTQMTGLCFAFIAIVLLSI